jgi:PIN domain nuclease of toxin-antitoxin system
VILLDTHVVLWLAEAGEELSAVARQTIRKERESGHLAIAGRTLWEIAFLVENRKVRVASPLGAFLHEVESRFVVLPMTAAIAEQSVRFSSRFPRDPSDRVIAATAFLHSISLVTRDEQIHRSKEIDCIW